MATYLLNILPHKTIAYYSSLHLLYHKEPSYSHMRVFGCLCFPLYPSTNIHKLQARSPPCVFLGYPSNHRGYKCYDPSSRKIIICPHVIFDERKFPFSSLHTPTSTTYDFLRPLSPLHFPSLPNPAPPTVGPSPRQPSPSPSLTSGPSTPIRSSPYPNGSNPVSPALSSPGAPVRVSFPAGPPPPAGSSGLSSPLSSFGPLSPPATHSPLSPLLVRHIPTSSKLTHALRLATNTTFSNLRNLCLFTHKSPALLFLKILC